MKNNINNDLSQLYKVEHGLKYTYFKKKVFLINMS